MAKTPMRDLDLNEEVGRHGPLTSPAGQAAPTSPAYFGGSEANEDGGPPIEAYHQAAAPHRCHLPRHRWWTQNANLPQVFQLVYSPQIGIKSRRRIPRDTRRLPLHIATRRIRVAIRKKSAGS
jgi:hypothetical protein